MTSQRTFSALSSLRGLSIKFAFLRLYYTRVLPERDLLPLASLFFHHSAHFRRHDLLRCANGRHAARECIRAGGRGCHIGHRFQFAICFVESEEARPHGVWALPAHRVADLASALFSRFIVFHSQKTQRKP